jgi:creatinine amidohydrolase
MLFIYLLFFQNLFALNPAESITDLSIQYEELTAPEFVQAVEKSEATCIIPCGILEKHGPHLPLGTDMIDIREIVLRAAKTEYCIVFPQYYFGQIYEAKHQPGTISYSPELIWNVLQETCDELNRNGIQNIVLANGHGGNNHFLHYFCQSQMAHKKNYAVLLFSPEGDAMVEEKINKLRQTSYGGHADEIETSMIMAHRPDLVHTDLGKNQSGEDLDRLKQLPYTYTGIWWYAKFPNHYAGDGSKANPEIGELIINSRVEQLVKLLQVIKSDKRIHELQGKFYEESENPLKTVQ